MSDAASALIELRDIVVPPGAPYETGLLCERFVLPPGELALVHVARELRRWPLADLLSGLIEPEAGRIAYRGRAWTDLSVDEQVRQRGRIGRVFDGLTSSWLSNLDVDENLTLALRMQGRDLGDGLARMERFARAVSAWPLPEARPGTLEPGLKRRLEWVRACLNGPELLILERPRRGAYGVEPATLLDLIAPVRAAGAAVLWVATDADEWQSEALKPDSRWRFTDGRLVRAEKS